MYLKNVCKLQERTFQRSQILRKTTAAAKLKLQTDYISDDYQYLEKSVLPTFHFQKSLLRLPIPELEKTCERYLSALKPLLNYDQFEKTKSLVYKFKSEEGKELHDALKTKDNMNKDTSYISKPWFDMYLKDRSPLPINYNPVLVFNKDMLKPESQLCVATNLTISSLRFLKSLKNNLLPPEVFHLNPQKSNTELFTNLMKLLPSVVASYGAYMFKAYPLDMSQYSSLFSSTRIPQVGKDSLVKHDLGKHVLVLRRGHFFIFDVLDNNGDILPPEDIFTCFKYVLDKDLKPNKESIGILTTENRDVWARAREHLVSINPDNFQSVKAIDSALFVLCLDDDIFGDDIVKIMHSFLHSDGINRWFDKSFNLIIAKDGTSGLNFEHSWGDGVAILRYFKDISTDITFNPFVNSLTKVSKISPGCCVKELKFELDDRMKNEIEAAKVNYDKVCNSLEINAFEQQGFGRNICKNLKISPDSMMQLSFQVAYHKIFGNFASTYESCSTAAFKHGRTETIRPCTTATQAFALSFNSQKKPEREELLNMIKQCSEVHKTLTKEAAMGQGFDRHLFGLKHISEDLGRPLPDLFKDEAYRLINYNILSTSTLSSETVKAGGFGPVVPDGFGIGYSILDNVSGSLITSYSTNGNGTQFAEALQTIFKEFSLLLSKN